MPSVFWIFTVYKDVCQAFQTFKKKEIKMPLAVSLGPHSNPVK
jgi:hypothetical protein